MRLRRNGDTVLAAELRRSPTFCLKMLRNTVLCCALVILLAEPASAQLDAAKNALVPRDSIQTLIYSENSGLYFPARLVIRDSALFAFLWPRISRDAANVPRVDFVHYQLVLAANGATPSIDTEIIVDTVETSGVVRVSTSQVANGCLTASSYSQPVHLVRLPISVVIRRFDERITIVKNCMLPSYREWQPRWVDNLPRR
jgi:hypothetical protein